VPKIMLLMVSLCIKQQNVSYFITSSGTKLIYFLVVESMPQKYG
jgi:hypothetical protein